MPHLKSQTTYCTSPVGKQHSQRLKLVRMCRGGSWLCSALAIYNRYKAAYSRRRRRVSGVCEGSARVVIVSPIQENAVVSMGRRGSFSLTTRRPQSQNTGSRRTCWRTAGGRICLQPPQNRWPALSTCRPFRPYCLMAAAIFARKTGSSRGSVGIFMESIGQPSLY